MKTLLVITFNEPLKQEVYLLAAHTHLLITDTILDTNCVCVMFLKTFSQQMLVVNGAKLVLWEVDLCLLMLVFSTLRYGC